MGHVLPQSILYNRPWTGEVLEIVEDGEGKTMKYVSEAYESEDGKLWIGVLTGRLGD